MKKAGAFGALTTLALFLSQPAFPQTSEELKALRKEVEAVKQGQSAIQKELQEIKGLLQGIRALPPQAQGQQPLGEVVLNLEGSPFKGNKNAKVTLVEFTDYQCPFCSRHFSQTLPQIEKDYIQTGKVKYVVRDFPLESIHPLAFKAAEAANCAGEQGKYWEMHDRLFANQNALGVQEMPNHAQALGLELPRFQQCLDSGKWAAGVRKSLDEGQKAGVTGTPGFFLGLTEPNGSKLRVTRTIKGAVPYAQFKQAIDDLISGQK